MRKNLFLLIILVLSFLVIINCFSFSNKTANIYASCIFHPHLSGNEYLSFSEENQTFYLIGLHDSLSLMMSIICKLSEDNNLGFNDFYNKMIEDMPVKQEKAIFDKYLKDHPEKWNEPCCHLFYEAMREASEKKQ